MKKWLPAILILVLGAVVVHLARNQTPRTQTPSAPASTPTTTHPAPAAHSAALSSDTPTPPALAAAPVDTLIPKSPAPPKEKEEKEVLLNPDGSPKLPSNEPPIAPATLMENVRTGIRSYGRLFGGNPVGTNEEITRALNGGNPKEARFLKAEDGMVMNRNGELVDSWGTPFFFHQLAADAMEIRSAGPDRILFTRDDLVLK